MSKRKDPSSNCEKFPLGTSSKKPKQEDGPDPAKPAGEGEQG